MTADTQQNNENWCISCIPEGEDLEPSPEDLESYFTSLELGHIPELSWKCPGRRQPSPVNKDEPKSTTESAEKQTPLVKQTDFDFMDDVSLPQMTRVRSASSIPKGSAKKKTANFAGVIDALKKQRLSSSQQHQHATSNSSKESSS